MEARYRGPRRTERAAWLVLVSATLIVAGCTIDAPRRVAPPPIEPASTGSGAATASLAITLSGTTAPSVATRSPIVIQSAAVTLSATVPPLPEPLVVRVVRGDTLWGIAHRYHVRLATLIAANPQFRDPRLIDAGDEVWIPREAVGVKSVGKPTSGTLVLSESTTLKADHRGNIVIETSGITLDCAGHTVYGPGSETWSGGIDIGFASDVTVKRCIVKGFVHNGLFGHHGKNIRLETNTLVGNGIHGVALDQVTGSAVVGNTSRLNGTIDPAIGIVITKSTGVEISQNVVAANPWAGIALFHGTTDSIVVANAATGNGIGIVLDGRENGTVSGITLRGNAANRNDHGITIIGSSENVIEVNTANRNAYAGFQVDGGSSSNTFNGNTANLNNDGFGLRGLNDNVVAANTANRNRHAGFLVWGGSSDNTLSGNTGRNNAWFDAYDEGTGTGNSWYGNRFLATSGI